MIVSFATAKRLVPSSPASTSRVLAAASGMVSQMYWPAAASGTVMAGGRGLVSGRLKAVPSGRTPAARRSPNFPCCDRSRSISRAVKPQG